VRRHRATVGSAGVPRSAEEECIGTKEAAEHAKIPLEGKLAFGADVIPPHPGGLPITFLWLPSLVR
jgi:hypothetical protein